MPLKLIVGPPNSGRAGEIRSRLLDEREREPVLVVPTADDIAWFERELCADGGAVLGVSIRTFAWLFEDLAAELALELGPSLSGPQRLALVRAAIGAANPRLLSRSATRPGFAPELEALIAELQAALVTPAALAAEAELLEDGDYEAELATLYGAYADLRDRSGRTDSGALAATVLAGVRSSPDAWGDRPLFLYGFDDLTRVQLELVEQLAQSAEVTVAVNYAAAPADRRALGARAKLLRQLRELGAETDAEVPFDETYTGSRTLRHLDQSLFEPDPRPVEPDEGLKLIECAGERGEAEAIGIEIAHLLEKGVDPGDVAVVLRHPGGGGPLLAQVLQGYGIPVALEADVPLVGTGVGRALVALSAAASPSGTAADLLAHLRADPNVKPSIADWLERRIRRRQVRSADEATAGWSSPPRHLSRLRSANGPAARLRALAAIALEIAEDPHRDGAPLAGERAGDAAPPFVPLEARAATSAAELLEELARVGELPGCEQPDLGDAIEAIGGASVRVWRGSAEGRVRILSPYRVRAGRARFLFCASLQDGEFPGRGAPDPLLGEDRRARLGIPELRRQEPAQEERYLFHACVSRPTEGLYLSWRTADDGGGALAPSPFVDEVLDLVGDGVIKITRGLDRVVPLPSEAPTAGDLARSLAAAGRDADHAGALRALSVPEGLAGPILERLGALPDPGAKPGPLRVPAVLEELRARRLLSANSLEGWLECPYRWFVQHELRPVRLEPEADPLWLGGVVHRALERLYAEAPGEDSIPRPGDVGDWKRRFGELLDEAVAERRREGDGDTGPPAAEGPTRSAALARAREQVERFLDTEAGSDTLLRPRMLERRFGFGDEDDPRALDLGEFSLRGIIDRIDVAPDGEGAVVRDYKTSREVPGAAAFAGKGQLQIQLYMRAVRDGLHLDPIAGLYQPLGATDDPRPRGIALKGDSRLEGLDLSWKSKDARDRDEFDELLDEAVRVAREAGAEMREGEIGRRPLGGRCSEYCEFQPICRLERAIGLEGEDLENGE